MDGDNLPSWNSFLPASSPALTSGNGFCPVVPHKKHPFFESSFPVFLEGVIYCSVKPTQKGGCCYG